MTIEPFIETPEERQVQDSDVFCFLDGNRPCSMECAAYLTARPDGPDYRGQPFAQCTVLVGIHRGGKHLTVLASQAESLLKHNRVKMADAVREANSPRKVP
jgi:hypothetical protein